MMISHKHKAVFIHPPRTGGTCVRTTLVGYDFVQRKGVPHIHIYDIPPEMDEYYKFGTVRNPYSRWVSYYENAVNVPGFSTLKFAKELSAMEFPEFTRLALINGVCLDILPASTMLGDATALHRESLSEDFSKLPFVGSPVWLPVINAYPHKDWMEYYDRMTLDTIYSCFKEDFDRYDYDKRILSK